MFTDFLIGLLLLVSLAIAVTGFLHIVVLKVPYIRTPKKIAKEMVRLADLQGNERVYDLGAGDGQVLMVAQEEYPTITAVGCEIVPTVWLLAQLHKLLRRSPVKILCRNALRMPIADADVIFLYVSPNLMRQLESKFDAELRHGARVISHSFRFPGRSPLREVKVAWRGGWKKLFLYQW